MAFWELESEQLTLWPSLSHLQMSLQKMQAFSCWLFCFFPLQMESHSAFIHYHLFHRYKGRPSVSSALILYSVSMQGRYTYKKCKSTIIYNRLSIFPYFIQQLNSHNLAWKVIRHTPQRSACDPVFITSLHFNVLSPYNIAFLSVFLYIFMWL